MPNLFNPQIFNVNGFLQEIQRQNFCPVTTEITVPVEGSQLYYSCCIKTQTEYFKIVDNLGILIACIRLNPREFLGKHYRVVERAYSHQKRMGGYIYLFKVAFFFGYNLMSDSTHTTWGSKDFWKSAKVRFPEATINFVDLDTDHCAKYEDQPDYEIWGIEADDDFHQLNAATKEYVLADKTRPVRFMGVTEPSFLNGEAYRYLVSIVDNIINAENRRLTIEPN